MRHVYLTCKHHPALRWMCKEIAFSGDGYGYNGARNIFFLGECCEGPLRHSTYFPDRAQPIVKECECSPRDLIRAPEDKEME